MQTDILHFIMDTASGVLLVLGCMLSLGAAIGMARFPDLMSRMHAASKPQILGLVLILSAVGLELREWRIVPILLLALLLQLLTVPISAHMVSRAGYRTKHRHPELLSADELNQVVEYVKQDGARKPPARRNEPQD